MVLGRGWEVMISLLGASLMIGFFVGLACQSLLCIQRTGLTGKAMPAGESPAGIPLSTSENEWQFPMRLPRLTTRRLLAPVAAVASGVPPGATASAAGPHRRPAC